MKRNTFIIIRFWILFIICFYLFINFEIILWHLIDPERFWGYVWFYLASFFSLSFIFVIWELFSASAMIKKETKKKEWVSVILYLFATTILGFFIYYGPVVLLSKNLSNRYNYVKQSKKYFKQGYYDKALNLAEHLFEKSKNITEVSPVFFIANLYLNSEAYQKDINNKKYQATYNYAVCLQASGKNINEAERLFKFCIKGGITQLMSGQDRIGESFLGLLKIYIAKGDRINAELCFQSIMFGMFFSDKSNIEYNIESLDFYADYKDFTGDYDKAAELRWQALNIQESLSSDETQDIYYLNLLIKVANTELNKGNIEETKNLIVKGEKIAEDNKDNALYIDYLKLNARYQEFASNYVESEKTYIKLLKEIKKRQGVNNTNFCSAMLQLAELYFYNEKYEKADVCIKIAMENISSKKQDEKEFYYTTLFYTAISDVYKKHTNDAILKSEELEKYLYDKINKSFTFLTDDQKGSYIESLSNQFDLLNYIYVNTKDSTVTERIYNNLLATKSIALQSNQYNKNYLKTYGDKNLIKEYEDIQEKRRKLNEQKLYGTLDTNAMKLKEYYIDRLEQNFAKKLSSKKSHKGFLANSIQWEDIRNSLKADEAAVEFFKIPKKPGKTDEINYYSLIIKHDSKHPVIIPLFEEKTLKKVLENNAYKGNYDDSINNIYSSHELYNLIWLPIKNSIKNCKTAYVSLTGILHLVSFPAITIDDDCNMVFLGSTRSIADTIGITKQPNIQLKATLYGGIDYDKAENANLTTGMMGNEGLRNIINDSPLGYLPQTKVEVEKIDIILRKKDYTSNPITGVYATERSLIDQTNFKPSILHIATHGFYYAPRQYFMIEDLISSKTGSSSLVQNPLFRSGLLFAGSKNQMQKTITSDDGIVTAQEISQLDLSGVDLVVLSACVTGLGDIKGNEGVYGLQRAFKMAGVNTIIMSLWQVADTQTSELMQEFYKFYLSGKCTKQEALKAAQKEIRIRYSKPFYWAGFVVVE